MTQRIHNPRTLAKWKVGDFVIPKTRGSSIFAGPVEEIQLSRSGHPRYRLRGAWFKQSQLNPSWPYRAQLPERPTQEDYLRVMVERLNEDYQRNLASGLSDSFAWKKALKESTAGPKAKKLFLEKLRASNPSTSRARFRHEDVSAVPAGWRVITVSHGDHRIRVAYPKRKKNKIGGADGRLISILHPIKENPAEGCRARSTNPAELVVLGANPPRKRNPLVYVVTAAHKKDVWQGIEKPFPSLKEAQEFAREIKRKSGEFFQPHILSMQQTEYEENPKRKNPGELVLMGANPGYPEDYSKKKAAALKALYDAHRSQGTSHEVALDRVVKDSGADSRAIEIFLSKIRHGNPSEAAAAGKLFEEFQGRPSEQIHITDEPHMPAGDYAQLARLVELGIEPNGHGKVVPLEFSRKDGVIIAAAPGSQQIYFVGGNQDITEILDEFEVNADMAAQPEVRLGRVRTIAYRAAKAQTGFTPSDYEHAFGEEGGELPEAIFDTAHKRILLKGGSYRIEAPGIIN